MEKALIIARCSTSESKQDVTRQVIELNNKYSNQFKIVKEFNYYKSGLLNDSINEEILDFATENDIENIIVTEISRISRRVLGVLQFIERCNRQKVNVIINNYNVHSLLDNKEPNSMVQTMLQIAATFSNMELNLTKERLQSGRKIYVAKGGRLGRLKGSKETVEQFLAKHKDIIKYLKQGQSIRNIVKLTSKSSGTIQKVKKLC